MYRRFGCSCLPCFKKMREKLLELFFNKMADTPVNKMAASRTGLKRDKDTVISDLLYFTVYL